MRTINLTIAYEGTNYCGWQIQPNGISIQEKMEEAIYRITRVKTTIHGSGRTDAGVHATGQSASFHTASTMSIDRLPYALNSVLPKDIAVVKAEEKEQGFHARYSAMGKRYSYHLYANPHQSPFNRLVSWHLRQKPDMQRMKETLLLFKGTHDFASFRATKSDIVNTTRTIWTAELTEKEGIYQISFEGNGFLYKMVRMLVAATVEVGLGKKEISDVRNRLAMADEQGQKLSAPPWGLFLQQVYYNPWELPMEAGNQEKGKKILLNPGNGVDTRGSMY